MMRFIIFFQFLMPIYVWGQTVCVSNIKQNILYEGIVNPLTVAAENISCDSILVTTTYGKIWGGNCQYQIRISTPDTIDLLNRIISVNIKVKGIVNGDTINLGNFPFRLHNMPLPVARVANRPGGEVSAAEMKVQKGVAAVVDDFDYPVKVKSYSLLIHNPIRTTHFYDVEGPYFTEEIKDYLFYLRSGDKVFVFDVQAELSNGEIVTLEPIQFDIE